MSRSSPAPFPASAWYWPRLRKSVALRCCAKHSPRPPPMKSTLPTKQASSNASATTFMSSTAPSATSKSPSLPTWNSLASISTLNAARPTSHERPFMSESRGVRCGIGYDLHRLAEGRPLIIGGITVPFDKGPVGHSDGDVLAHALCDPLFGAAGLAALRTHFPDTDPKWEGADSLKFLERARILLDEKNFKLEHVDAVVILKKPKLGPHFPKCGTAWENLWGVARKQIN